MKDSLPDVSNLLKFCQGDPEQVREFLQEALPSFRRNIHDLESSFLTSDVNSFLQAIHKLKGSLGVMEPGGLFKRAVAIETETGDAMLFIQPDSTAAFIRDLKNFAEQLTKY